MTKKSVLLATLLAGMSALTGCNEKGEKTPESSEAQVQQAGQAQMQNFEEMARNIPIFRDELPHTMILPNGKGGYVQILYPARKDGTVVEDKDQYEKRVKWLNEKYPINIPQPGLSLRGCKWVDYSNEPRLPFVSIFDKKEYIYHHINWMKGFYKPRNKFGVNYTPEKDPLVLWWATQVEFHGLFAPQKGAQKGRVTSRQREGKQP